MDLETTFTERSFAKQKQRGEKYFAFARAKAGKESPDSVAIAVF